MKMRENHSGMEAVFALLLLGMFAVSCLFLTVLGVRVYRSSAASYAVHNTERILSAYVRSMVRTMDEEGVVRAETAGGLDTLSFTEDYEGERYVTRLYCSGGKLREWFSAEEYEFKPEDGTPICDAADFSASISGDLIRVTIREKEGDAPVETAIKLFSPPDMTDRP